MNGKHSTLLTWFGKSERPVAMTASGRAALARSGMISGSGLASARISGLSAICASHSGFSTLRRGEPEEDVGAGEDLGERARLGRLRVARLVVVHLLACGPA